MPEEYYYTSMYESSTFGDVEIECTDAGITAIRFDCGISDESGEEFHPLIQDCIFQLESYIRDGLKKFTVPIALEGSEFQIKVWEALRKIPYGKTVTYLDIAIELGDRNLVRAVGSANGSNPIPIIVPCHRVIGISGKLVGYSGGLPMKKMLLNLERENMPQYGLF